MRETAFGILTAVSAICFVGALVATNGPYNFRAVYFLLLASIVVGAIAASLVQ